MIEQIKLISGELPSLRAVMVTAMPDCLLFDSWLRDSEAWSADQAATYYGDLIRANHAGLKAMNALSKKMQVTVEADDVLVVVSELRDNFVLTCVFERDVPLGMVRLFVRRIEAIADEKLPSLEINELPRGVKILDFLRKYAPDPHAVLKRASLRSAIPASQLRDAQNLSAEQIERLENAAKQILGLDQLHI